MDYLTIEELKRLQGNTEVAHPLSRLALLFSCYTGLQSADIESVQFDHIHHAGAGLMIVKPQRNNNQPIRVPLGAMACDIFNQVRDIYINLPAKQQDGFLFHSIDREALSHDICEWAHKAGIERDIDITIGRATFCILALQAGVGQEELSHWCGCSLQAISKYKEVAAPLADRDIDAFDALFAPYL